MQRFKKEYASHTIGTNEKSHQKHNSFDNFYLALNVLPWNETTFHIIKTTISNEKIMFYLRVIVSSVNELFQKRIKNCE